MKLKLTSLCLLFILSYNIHPTVRYVSKTGTSTAPYSSWATASDGIQKAINICSNGDTIVVGNGVYKEVLNISKPLCLIGTSMDSTVIDSRGMKGPPVDTMCAISINSSGCRLKNLHIYGLRYGKNGQVRTSIVRARNHSVNIEGCFLEVGGNGLSFLEGSYTRNCFIRNCYSKCIIVASLFDSTKSTIENCVMIADETGIYHLGGGTFRILNNIVISPEVTTFGPRTGFYMGPAVHSGLLANNLFIGGESYGILAGYPTDTLRIMNNVVLKCNHYALSAVFITLSPRTIFRNNIIAHNSTVGVDAYNHKNIDYNLYWRNNRNRGGDNGTPVYTPNDIVADPMFVNDTITFSYPLKADFHLEKYSPCIDKGDPSILDKDGTRSDIGLYGGPYGESYSYNDLAPRAPRGLTIKAADSVTVVLKWRRNTEKDTSSYIIYSSPVAGVTVGDSASCLMETKDTLITYNLGKERKVYFRLKAKDKGGNLSPLSGETGIDVTSADSPITTPDEYCLYSNYPNPFNPSTTISYSLKERGKVRLTIYDIKGELIKTILDKEESKGYHEVTFNADGLSSGIYLYRIEVTGKGGIPKYSDMKKMVYVK